MKPVRVLVVDDSSLVRRILTTGLAEDPNIVIVGEARDAYEARDLIVRLRPDVLTLDVEMPRMDGVTFLRNLMEHMPMPVLMLSTLTQERATISLEALEAGAVDVVAKPIRNVGQNLGSMLVELRAKVKAAARARIQPITAARPAVARTPTKGGAWQRSLLAIGASTGGTEALTEVLSNLPVDTPATVIVQHMPAAFTGAFASRLNGRSPMHVLEARHGMVLKPGQALLAPGGLQMRVLVRDGERIVSVQPGPPVQGHAPSVDVLMHSVAEVGGPGSVGAILTGMGADGAEGLLAMRKRGARTLAQDEASSVVYGMPKMATVNGGAEMVRPLRRVASTLVDLLRSPADRRAA